LQHPHQESGHAGGTVAASQIGGFSVGNQVVVDQWQPVATGLEALPYGHLLICCELVKSTGFDGFDQTIQGGVEGIQGHIHRCAFDALLCWWIPEFHTTHSIRTHVR
jgi:hypothetical protein